MPDARQAQVESLLGKLVVGDDGALAELVPLVYAELRRLAEELLRDERRAWSIQPTSLVHEAYLRLAGAEDRGWRSKARFAAVAARSMREILVDHARQRQAQKRGGDRRRVTLSGAAPAAPARDVIALDDLLQRLAALHPRAAQVLELHVFADMTGQEIAEVVGVSRRTIDKDLVLARGWLARELRPE
ncbi:MAG: ECF-type sigma factor [Planctomycetota bacterium]